MSAIRMNDSDYEKHMERIHEIQSKLKWEAVTTKKNSHRLTVQWREILRHEFGLKLRKEIQLLQVSFERHFDHKTCQIGHIFHWLREAERQMGMLYSQHRYFLNRLSFIHSLRQQSLSAAYDQVTGEEISAGFSDLEADKNRFQKQMNELSEIRISLEDHATHIQFDALNHFSSNVSTQKSQLNFDKQKFRFVLENKVRILWTDYQTRRNSYRSTEHAFRTCMDRLTASLNKNDREINVLNAKYRQLGNQIALCRKRISGEMADFVGERESLVTHIMVIAGYRDNLRKRFRSFSVENHAKLSKLVNVIDESRQHMLQLVKKAEKILKFAEICRKWQNESEKVLPFIQMSQNSKNGDDKCKSQVSFIIESEQYEADYLNAMLLKRFWIRFNRATLDVCVMFKQREALAKEREYLKERIQQYLDSISSQQLALTKQNFTG